MLDDEITGVKREIANINGSIAGEYDRLAKCQRRLSELEARNGMPYWTLDERSGPHTAIWKRIDGLTVPRYLVVFRSNGVGISEMEVLAGIGRKYRILATTKVRYPKSWMFWTRVRWFFSYQRAPTLNFMVLLWKVCLLCAAIYLISIEYVFLGAIVGLIAVCSSLVDRDRTTRTTEDEGDEDVTTITAETERTRAETEQIRTETERIENETMNLIEHEATLRQQNEARIAEMRERLTRGVKEGTEFHTLLLRILDNIPNQTQSSNTEEDEDKNG